jgi:hypothetical protein
MMVPFGVEEVRGLTTGQAAYSSSPAWIRSLETEQLHDFSHVIAALGSFRRVHLIGGPAASLAGQQAPTPADAAGHLPSHRPPMTRVLLINRSPTPISRSAALLDHARTALLAAGLEVSTASILDFPAEDLIQASFGSASFASFIEEVNSASGIIVSTPVYKASFSGGLKALLDILPCGFPPGHSARSAASRC